MSFDRINYECQCHKSMACFCAITQVGDDPIVIWIDIDPVYHARGIAKEAEY